MPLIRAALSYVSPEQFRLCRPEPLSGTRKHFRPTPVPGGRYISSNVEYGSCFFQQELISNLCGASSRVDRMLLRLASVRLKQNSGFRHIKQQLKRFLVAFRLKPVY
jgi:hypothetical protein